MAKKSVKKTSKKTKSGSIDPVKKFVNAYKMPIAFALIVLVAFVPIPSMQTNSQGESSFELGDSLATRLFAGSSAELSQSEVGQIVIDYLNANLVAAGTEASLVSVTDLGAVYQVTTEYQGNQIPVFATKDGKYLSLELLDMAQQIQQTQETATPQVETRDTPVAHAFVMSYCPYGLQFLKAYVPVIELLGDKADLQINFVSYIMHGEQEIAENNRMYCIQAEQQELFTDYLRCFVAEGKSAECIASVGVDQTALDTCIAELDEQFNITGLYDDQTTWSGGRYPQYPVELELNALYGVGGSPTFILNDASFSVARSPEAIKQAVCAGFTTPPAECSQTLSTAEEAAGLGPMGSGTTENTGTAQCG